MMLMPETPGDEPLAQEKYLVKNAKKIGLLILGFAAQKFGNALENEQEILVNIADIISNIYAMESVVLRTEKAIRKTGVEKCNQKLYYTQISVRKLFMKIEQDAKETLIGAEQGDSLRMMLSALRKFTRFNPMNIILLKRTAANTLIDSERYFV